MNSSSSPERLTPAGRNLLDRRRFLSGTATGMSGVALAGLLGSDRLLASTGDPIRPEIDPAHPHGARRPHFAARARRVLVIFCSGALSHVDTFDYKPELIRMDGKSMTGAATPFRRPRAPGPGYFLLRGTEPRRYV